MYAMSTKGMRHAFSSKEDIIKEAESGNTFTFKPLYILWSEQRDDECLATLLNAMVSYAKKYLAGNNECIIDEHLIYEVAEDFILEGIFASSPNWVNSFRVQLDILAKKVARDAQEALCLKDAIGASQDVPDFDMCVLSETIDWALSTLSPRLREVIKLRFGFEYGNPLYLEEVGNILGVSRERVRMLENDAIRKLRHPSRSKKLKDFYR